MNKSILTQGFAESPLLGKYPGVPEEALKEAFYAGGFYASMIMLENTLIISEQIKDDFAQIAQISIGDNNGG